MKRLLLAAAAVCAVGFMAAPSMADHCPSSSFRSGYRSFAPSRSFHSHRPSYFSHGFRSHRPSFRSSGFRGHSHLHGHHHHGRSGIHFGGRRFSFGIRF